MGNAGYGGPIAVNVSATQFHQPDFVDKVKATLARNGLPPECLELELTESVLMQDIDRNLPSLNALRETWVKLSLDDFDTRYSSLAYLRRLHITNLKIDRAFITSIMNADTDQAMVRTMIEMAHLLGLNAIAEGVETEEQADLLRRMGCDEFQGYYYSKPVAAGEMARWWQILQDEIMPPAGGALN